MRPPCGLEIEEDQMLLAYVQKLHVNDYEELSIETDPAKCHSNLKLETSESEFIYIHRTFTLCLQLQM